MHEFIRAALQTGSGAAATLLLGIISTKITAEGLGPAGIGLLTVLTQLLATATMLATFGGGAALIQGIAGRVSRARDEYLATVLLIYCGGALVTAIGLMLSAPWFAGWLIDRDDAPTVALTRWLMLPATVTLAQFFMANVMNGHRAIGRLAGLQAAGAAATAIVAYPLTVMIGAGHSVAIVALLTASPFLRLLISLRIVQREGWLDSLRHGFTSLIRKEAAMHFFRLGGATLVISLAGTTTLLALNAMIVQRTGATGLGQFSAAWALSSTYVLLILNSFGAYYLPTLSSTHDTASRSILMHRTLRLSLVLVVPLIVTIILLKPLIISLLYSSDFLPATATFRWLLIGDYFKVLSWVVAMPVVAYADVKVFLRTELLWQIGFLAFSALAVLVWGTTQGVGAGCLILYVGNLMYYLWYSKRRHMFWPTIGTIVHAALGLIVVLIASALTWNDVVVNWHLSTAWMLLAPAYVWITLTGEERRALWSTVWIRRGMVAAA